MKMRCTPGKKVTLQQNCPHCKLCLHLCMSQLRMTLRKCDNMVVNYIMGGMRKWHCVEQKTRILMPLPAVHWSWIFYLILHTSAVHVQGTIDQVCVSKGINQAHTHSPWTVLLWLLRLSRCVRLQRLLPPTMNSNAILKDSLYPSLSYSQYRFPSRKLDGNWHLAVR